MLPEASISISRVTSFDDSLGLIEFIWVEKSLIPVDTFKAQYSIILLIDRTNLLNVYRTWFEQINSNLETRKTGKKLVQQYYT